MVLLNFISSQIPFPQKMLWNFLTAPTSQALRSSFWWSFLHLHQPTQEIEEQLFHHFAKNSAFLLLDCRRFHHQEALIKVLIARQRKHKDSEMRWRNPSPQDHSLYTVVIFLSLNPSFCSSLLSQALCICSCSTFPRSCFGTDESKTQLCNAISEWMIGESGFALSLEMRLLQAVGCKLSYPLSFRLSFCPPSLNSHIYIPHIYVWLLGPFLYILMCKTRTLPTPRSYTNWDYSQLEPEKFKMNNLCHRRESRIVRMLMNRDMDKLLASTNLIKQAKSSKFKQILSLSHFSFLVSSTMHNSDFSSYSIPSEPLSLFYKTATVCKQFFIRFLQRSLTLLGFSQVVPLNGKHDIPSSPRNLTGSQSKPNIFPVNWANTKGSDPESEFLWCEEYTHSPVFCSMADASSHPTCCGPDLTRHLFSINGHSPLIHHFLQSCNAELWSGQEILIHRRELSNPIPYP
ncbi:LOW QUALITY PROTEIN: protein FAM227A [Spheniscus humboldti]